MLHKSGLMYTKNKTKEKQIPDFRKYIHILSDYSECVSYFGSVENFSEKWNEISECAKYWSSVGKQLRSIVDDLKLLGKLFYIKLKNSI